MICPICDNNILRDSRAQSSAFNYYCYECTVCNKFISFHLNDNRETWIGGILFRDQTRGERCTIEEYKLRRYFYFSETRVYSNNESRTIPSTNTYPTVGTYTTITSGGTAISYNAFSTPAYSIIQYPTI